MGKFVDHTSCLYVELRNFMLLIWEQTHYGRRKGISVYSSRNPPAKESTGELVCCVSFPA
jgi:hypothetical protein